MKIKKFEGFIDKEVGMEFPTKSETGLRTKLDAAMLQYLKYQNKIDLDFMKSDRMKLTGDDEYNKLYHYMIDALKKYGK